MYVTHSEGFWKKYLGTLQEVSSLLGVEVDNYQSGVVVYLQSNLLPINARVSIPPLLAFLYMEG